MWLLWFFNFSATAGPCEDSYKNETTNAGNKSTNEVVVSGTPPAVEFQLPVVGSVDSPANQFSRAFNKGEFRGDARFISFFENNPHYATLGEVVSVKDNTVEVKVVDNRASSWTDNWSKKKVILSSKELDNAEVSVRSRDFYRKVLKFTEFPKSIGPFKISRSNEEAELKKQGFKDDYIRGVDEVNALIELAEKLRESNIHPYKTHIEHFAQQIPEVVAYFRNNHLFTDQTARSRLRDLEKLEAEAVLRVDKKEVTYEWWVLWNVRLVGWSTLSYNAGIWKELPKNWWKSHKTTKKLLEERNEEGDIYLLEHLDDFPGIIIIPDVHNRDLGIMATNNLSVAPPVVIMNLSAKNKDGKNPMESLVDSFESLWGKLSYSGTRNYDGWLNPTPIDKFYSQLKAVSQSLSVEQRMHIEAVWFAIVTEIEMTPVHISYPETIQYAVVKSMFNGSLINRITDLFYSKDYRRFSRDDAFEKFIGDIETIKLNLYRRFGIDSDLHFDLSRDIYSQVDDTFVVMKMVNTFSEAASSAVQRMGNDVAEAYKKEERVRQTIRSAKFHDEMREQDNRSNLDVEGFYNYNEDIKNQED